MYIQKDGVVLEHEEIGLTFFFFFFLEILNVVYVFVTELLYYVLS